MVKKVITNLDLSKASGPDCIPVVVLKNLVFQIVGRFHRWSLYLYLRMLGIGLQLKTNCPAILLSVVSEVFEKLVNDRIVDCLEKSDLFSDL